MRCVQATALVVGSLPGSGSVANGAGFHPTPYLPGPAARADVKNVTYLPAYATVRHARALRWFIVTCTMEANSWLAVLFDRTSFYGRHGR